MRIVVAPNAFKESLTAWQAAAAIERGLRAALPEAQIVLIPVADGGDGTVETMVRATGGALRTASARDPLGRPVEARWGDLGPGHGAVIEMAAASGLTLLKEDERDPLRTSTHGLGDLIEAALDAGRRRILIGIGGSATVDGGTGMADALGIRFLDAEGNRLHPDGATLRRIARIDPAPWRERAGALDPPLEVDVACDVDNPLLGPEGAARVFGPQKGAGPEAVEMLEEGLANFADCIGRDLGVDVRPLAGGGAAGGLGAGLAAFLGARLRPGARAVLEAVGFEQALDGADWVITGEGSLDGQTARGKAPGEVARAAARRGVPVVGLAGRLGEGASELLAGDFCGLFAIADGPMTAGESMRRAGELLEALARSVGGLLGCA